MISFSEVLERASAGPLCSERDFDLDIFVPNLRSVVAKYDIKYDQQNPVPADDELADRVWAAAMEFLCNTGVYCLDTERLILFTREEIEEAIKTGPRGIVFGADKDAKAMPRRFPEDETLPWCSVGACGSPVSSEWYLLNLVKAYAENPLGDSITTPSLTRVDGRQVVADSPVGVEGAIRTMIIVREALRRAGRPGMPIVNAVATAVRSQEHIAGHHFGIRTTDALEIGTVHELKVDFDSMNKIAYSLATGSLIFGENGMILGGLAGGPAGLSVVTAAYNPVDLLVMRAAVQHPFPTHFDIGSTSTRDTIWVRNLANQAISRNSTLPVNNCGYITAGPMTKMAFYEYAAWVIGSVVCGGSIEAGGSSRGTSVDYTSPVEPLFCSEVAHAVAGMSRKEANRITIALLEKYEDRLRTPPVGKKYQECCDVVTGAPNKEFIELYREVRQEMTDQFGLKFQRSSPYL